MKGKQAELIAKAIFIIKGHKIIASNYITGKGTHAGEIDFIATRSNTIIFVEVKKRKNINSALQAISQKQKQRISNGIKAFLKYHPQYKNYNKRIDGVFIESILKLKHIKNIW